MNAQFIPLSGRTELPHTYVLTTDKQDHRGAALAPSHRSLTRLERGRLATKEVTESYFSEEKILIGHTVRELKGEFIIPWNQVVDAKLILMSAKTIHIALQRILRQLDWERLSDYLQKCRQKLKENLHQYYLRIKEHQEELQRIQLKKEVLSQ